MRNLKCGNIPYIFTNSEEPSQMEKGTIGEEVIETEQESSSEELSKNEEGE